MRCWIDFNCINVLFASSFYISCFDKFCYLETFPSFLLLFTLHYTSRRSFMNPNPRPSSYVHYPGNKFTVICDFVLHHRGKNRRSGLTFSNDHSTAVWYFTARLIGVVKEHIRTADRTKTNCDPGVKHSALFIYDENAKFRPILLQI